MKFDQLTACSCEVHINAGSSVNLDVELLWNPLFCHEKGTYFLFAKEVLDLIAPGNGGISP